MHSDIEQKFLKIIESIKKSKENLIDEKNLIIISIEYQVVGK